MHEDDEPLMPFSHQVVFTWVVVNVNAEVVANCEAAQAHINDEHTWVLVNSW